MAQLPLKTRRMRARGFNSRLAGIIGGRTFRGIGNRATATVTVAGNNNDIVLIAQKPGTGGNAITVALVAAGNNTPLSVSVAGNAITVNLATNGAGAVTSTANDVIRAVNFNPQALVWAQLAPANDGTGIAFATGATNLTGGVAFTS